MFPVLQKAVIQRKALSNCENTVTYYKQLVIFSVFSPFRYAATQINVLQRILSWQLLAWWCKRKEAGRCMTMLINYQRSDVVIIVIKADTSVHKFC